MKLNRLLKPLRKAYVRTTTSIAFLPTFITLAFFSFSLGVLSLEESPGIEQVERKFDFLIVHGVENARLVLSAIITGIISLMVFSFSMVMIILSQASSNQSPRVIPGLISEKAYQVVLGFYTGTIIYTFMMVLNIEEAGPDERVPETGVLLAMVMAISCIALFVYFIHSVSRSIQVDNILKRVFHEAAKHLKWETEQYGGPEAEDQVHDVSDWTILPSLEEGFLTLTERTKLVKFAKKNDLVIEVLVKSGHFTVIDFPLVRVSRDIRQDPDLLEELYSFFIFSLSELNIRHYQYSLQQISEVAVKALSPGINDPGTALAAIHMMTMIFIRKMTCPNDRFLIDRDGQVRVIRSVYTLDELLYKYLMPIRHYGQADVRVLLGMLDLFRYLLFHDQKEKKYHTKLLAHVQTIQGVAWATITTPIDRQQVEQKVERLLQGNLLDMD